MSTFLSGITDDGVISALEKTLVFHEARLKVIAENVANAQTPGYRAKQLDDAAFRQSLSKALAVRIKNPHQPLVVTSGREVTTAPDGRLRIRPTEKPVENILFHDGTNLSIDRQMAELAKTGVTHEMTSSLLKHRFDGLKKAIRGTAS